jgi:hypothetical protein
MGLETVDEVAGLPARYATKLLGHRRVLRPMSFGAVLGARGLNLAVLPDNDALARVRHRLLARQGPGGDRLQIGGKPTRSGPVEGTQKAGPGARSRAGEAPEGAAGDRAALNGLEGSGGTRGLRLIRCGPGTSRLLAGA